MPNPRSRRKTKGAFGKPKHLSAGANLSNQPVRQPAPGEFNISNALVEFAKPITEQAGNNHTAMRGAMNVAILLWNAIIEGEKALATAKEKLLALPGATAEQVSELVESMTARKAELYPDAKQLITNFDLNFRKKGAQIRVASVNIAPPGVEKTGIAENI